MARFKDLFQPSLDDVKGFLRVTHGADDLIIEMISGAAIGRIDSLVGVDSYEQAEDIPAELKLAAMRLCVAWYQTRRDAASEGSGGYSMGLSGRVPNDVMALISPSRKKPWL